MAIRTYSVSRDGDKYVSKNFKVREFRCKDGSDGVLIDDALVNYLQKIRDYFGKSITINSAYRTESHNKAVGGASHSQHLFGTAADIVVDGVSPVTVAQYAEYIGAGGVGLYTTFTHVDARAVKTRWDQRSGRQVVVSGFGGQDQFKNKEVDDVTEERVIEIVKEVLEGKNTTVPEWAKKEWDEAKMAGITDGTRPEGYAKRDEVASMIARAIVGEE